MNVEDEEKHETVLSFTALQLWTLHSPGHLSSETKVDEAEKREPEDEEDPKIHEKDEGEDMEEPKEQNGDNKNHKEEDEEEADDDFKDVKTKKRKSSPAKSKEKESVSLFYLPFLKFLFSDELSVLSDPSAATKEAQDCRS